LSDLALLISWPLLLSAALKADPFGSGNPGMSAAKRRAIFAASIAISLTFFALYRFAYPWFHAG